MENAPEIAKPNTVLVGFKSSGKTSAGKELASLLNLDFTDLDETIEEMYAKRDGETLTFREIYKKQGKEYFRDLETQALKEVMDKENVVLSTGGGTPMFAKNAEILKKIGNVVYLKVDPETLYKRFEGGEMPAFFDKDNPRGSFEEFLAERGPVYEKIADLSIETEDLSPEGVAKKIKDELAKNATKEMKYKFN